MFWSITIYILIGICRIISIFAVPICERDNFLPTIMKNILTKNFLTVILVIAFVFLALYQLKKEHIHAKAKENDIKDFTEKPIEDGANTNLAGLN